jgi:putative FmdB family regulatory protein
MPTYPYKCHECGKRFEVIQKISAEKHTQCAQVNPSCEKKTAPVERMIANPSFVLKGGGWYKDGYS